MALRSRTGERGMGIAFIDLQAQRQRIAGEIDQAIARVLDHGMFVMGPEVSAFEEALSAFSGAKHTCACASGTDALALPLMAWDLRPGDAVFCPSFTFTATAEVVPWLGATPVFVDIDPATYNMCPQSLEDAIKAIKAKGELTPKVVIAVDLFGQPADYPALRTLCDQHGLKLIADAAQGFGSTIDGRHAIEWADVVTTSFFPAKPLGCYGDGGAVQTQDPQMWALLDSLRIHGKASAADMAAAKFEGHEAKYLNTRIGMNSRLDAIQAAILMEKLAIFGDEINRREAIAQRYHRLLDGHVLSTPFVKPGYQSTWAQYTVEVADRPALQKRLSEAGIPSAAYYPVPMHEQAPYRRFPCAPGGLPVTEEKKDRVLSLPMHPYLDEATQDQIAEGMRSQAG